MTTNRESACRPTVLCVDDETAVLHALDRVLRRYGCRVVWADNGPAALELLATQQVEVLICDHAMRGMAGIEVLCRAKTISPATSRILLTGRCGDQTVVIPAVNDGEIFRLLAKPWHEEELRRAVADALGSAPEAWRRQRQRAAQRLEAFGVAVGGGACCRPTGTEAGCQPTSEEAHLTSPSPGSRSSV